MTKLCKARVALADKLLRQSMVPEFEHVIELLEREVKYLLQTKSIAVKEEWKTLKS